NLNALCDEFAILRRSRNRLYLPLPILVNDEAVRVNRPAAGFGAHVADHVPVERRHILAAGLRVGVAEGEVEGAADLFVVERVPAILLDAVVVPHGALAEEPCA